MKKHPKLITAIKLSLIFIFIPGLIFYSLRVLNQRGFFNINDVVIVYEKTPDQKNYFDPLLEKIKLDLNNLKGQSLLSLDFKKISQQLKSRDWIANFHISKSWPQALKITIQPQAVKLLLVKGTQLIPVIENGSLLTAVEAHQAPDVILLNESSFSTDRELRKKAIKMTQEIPPEGSFSQKKISEIFYDKKEGFWVQMVDQGLQVKLGEGQVSLKSARVGQVLDYVKSHDIKPRLIDANLSKKVILKLEKNEKVEEISTEQ
jgi:cell division protein FtsQ